MTRRKNENLPHEQGIDPAGCYECKHSVRRTVKLDAKTLIVGAACGGFPLVKPANWNVRREGLSVELDAIPPAMLRELVTDAIVEHLPDEAMQIKGAEEESTRAYLAVLADAKNGDRSDAAG
jgi:hypothetical protein